MSDGTRGIVMGPKAAIKRDLAWQMRRAMTPAETTLWQAIRSNRLAGHHFRRQQVIDGFIVDFYCHAARLVVEVDGESHMTNAAYDSERDSILAARGLHTLRLSNSEVLSNLPACLASILRAAGREANLPLPVPGTGCPRAGRTGG